MPYSDQEIAVLKKYKILNEAGEFRQVSLRSALPGGKALGPGPVMSPDVVDKLLAADTTPDKIWIDWIFYEAGGGKAAVERTDRELITFRDDFIIKRENGWTHPESRVFYPRVPRKEAQERWIKAEPKFRDALSVVDQDLAVRGLFGYFRDWPGKDNRYANVVEAIKKYLKIYPKIVQFNDEMTAENRLDELLPEKPEDAKGERAIAIAATKVERYYAIKKSRKDVRQETIYSDDVITAIAPLTYAAAVRYGYEEWPWSAPEGFERVLGTGPTTVDWNLNDVWKHHVSKKAVFVFLSFKAPVPAWVTKKGSSWQHKDLTDLALKLNKDSLRGNVQGWQVYDQESNDTRTVAQIQAMILDEPARKPDSDEEDPLKLRGGNVYKTEDEALHVERSFMQAIEAVRAWLAKFNFKKVKADVLTLD